MKKILLWWLFSLLAITPLLTSASDNPFENLNTNVFELPSVGKEVYTELSTTNLDFAYPNLNLPYVDVTLDEPTTVCYKYNIEYRRCNYPMILVPWKNITLWSSQADNDFHNQSSNWYICLSEPFWKWTFFYKFTCGGGDSDTSVKWTITIAKKETKNVSRWDNALWDLWNNFWGSIMSMFRSFLPYWLWIIAVIVLFNFISMRLTRVFNGAFSSTSSRYKDYEKTYKYFERMERKKMSYDNFVKKYNDWKLDFTYDYAWESMGKKYRTYIREKSDLAFDDYVRQKYWKSYLDESFDYLNNHRPKKKYKWK